MTTSTGPYTQLAALFSYPCEGFVMEVAGAQAFLDEACAEAAEELREFTEFSAHASPIQLEEVYTRSFDVQAITTLDLGYVLFGDDYKRGQLLVNLNREHREAGVDCRTELPDHLPNVLRLLDVMQDHELRDEIVQKLLAPALRRIIREFDPSRIDKKNAVFKKHYKTLIERSERYGIIYGKALRALYALLKQEFNVETVETPHVPQQSRFLSSIGAEMTMECNKGKRHGATG